MALEYIVAGRRALPGMLRIRTWSWDFALDDERDEDADDYDDEQRVFDDGSFELQEVRRRGDANFYAWVEQHAGFTPKSVITIRPAGWEFSRAAAEVLAGALEGVFFVDGLVAESSVCRVPATPAAKSIDELQSRIEAASRDAGAFFDRWAAAGAKAQAEHDRLHPEDAALRARENDWSDV